MNLAFNVPINSVSFGQTSILILRTIYDRIKGGQEINVKIFPVGNSFDLSAQPKDNEFESWLLGCVDKAFTEYRRTEPLFKLWHLNGSMESFSNDTSLLSFYELDSPTDFELNCAANNKTLFSCRETQQIFKDKGVSVGYLPLAFDSYNFSKTNRKHFSDERIVFSICGKFEKRKHHAKTIKAWIKKYGNNPQYSLHCAVYNPFLKPEQNQQLIAQHVLQGQPKPFNVNFYPSMSENNVYNDFLNSADIVLGMSGGEGWGLPEFQSVAIGKHAVILNASAYRDWATTSNAVLVQPNGKEEVYDGMFFSKGAKFNQGNIYTWNESDFLSACDTAIARARSQRLNSEGLKLQEEFSKEKLVNNIIKLLS